ncbi:unnamed protein product [Angiostrongylus costaricensis]|uniref:NRF domain-containing protein n=1 Tax=Angiostrongylus costaricensis TaxID=334426 RepID=A0A0R3PPJ4_ANGCS|nr:unnamed protein product [Angiostrongylus costaricensis]
MITLQLAIVFGTATLSYGSECVGKTPPAEMDLSSISFLQSYKVSGVISDWFNKNAVAFDEFANSDLISTLLSYRSGTSLQWVTIKADKNVFLYNRTIGYCDKANSSCLESFPELLRVSKNLSSMATLLEGLVDFSKTNKGFKRGHKIVAGMKGVHWVSCVKDTDGSDNLQVEVVFTDENPLKPPSSAFNNPLVVFLQVGVYGNFSGEISEQFSILFI